MLRQIRAAGFRLTAVLGNAESGDNSTLRTTLHRMGLPYELGVSSTLSVFLGTRRTDGSGASRPRTRPTLGGEAPPPSA